ncbi:Hypothetical predicted protein [Marmota monax]|uniref:Uncharacterized protein n=1 Tax=Marmota monax TaxID=9995 RepID=A0A5E4A3W8_MARMO|nr:hypothetical protein GHT09_001676 [Marmota monax]VTJ51695.1 Hypothetical predicted protein [Marmota monax]
MVTFSELQSRKPLLSSIPSSLKCPAQEWVSDSCQILPQNTLKGSTPHGHTPESKTPTALSPQSFSSRRASTDTKGHSCQNPKETRGYFFPTHFPKETVSLSHR